MAGSQKGIPQRHGELGKAAPLETPELALPIQVTASAGRDGKYLTQTDTISCSSGRTQIKLELSWDPPDWLAFTVPDSTYHPDRGENYPNFWWLRTPLIMLSAHQTRCACWCSISMTAFGAENYFLIGFRDCSLVHSALVLEAGQIPYSYRKQDLPGKLLLLFS